ncbi:hypothetical protein B296_00019372 [Ensete ventricosum]|uniref:Uncharacterized protein n=1 Tax=Ensete ventricosum TaxID=4639 RepID=A0A427AQD4_ENSVE|nr:hypothetical protein B296_00019372 [Ensete ventricosum]
MEVLAVDRCLLICCVPERSKGCFGGGHGTTLSGPYRTRGCPCEGEASCYTTRDLVGEPDEGLGLNDKKPRAECLWGKLEIVEQSLVSIGSVCWQVPFPDERESRMSSNSGGQLGSCGFFSGVVEHRTGKESKGSLVVVCSLCRLGAMKRASSSSVSSMNKVAWCWLPVRQCRSMMRRSYSELGVGRKPNKLAGRGCHRKHVEDG